MENNAPIVTPNILARQVQVGHMKVQTVGGAQRGGGGKRSNWHTKYLVKNAGLPRGRGGGGNRVNLP